MQLKLFYWAPSGPEWCYVVFTIKLWVSMPHCYVWNNFLFLQAKVRSLFNMYINGYHDSITWIPLGLWFLCLWSISLFLFWKFLHTWKHLEFNMVRSYVECHVHLRISIVMLSFTNSDCKMLMPGCVHNKGTVAGFF